PVLVVDDNATNRRILLDTLSNWGLKPVAVEGGAVALMALYQAHEAGEPFPLVLLDCHMPEMDGFRLATEIKVRPALSATTIIMLTWAGQISDCERRRQIGLAACLTKPVKQAELLSAIVMALGHAARSAQQPADTSQAAPVEQGKRLRILLAEDNIVNQ